MYYNSDGKDSQLLLVRKHILVLVYCETTTFLTWQKHCFTSYGRRTMCFSYR